MRAILVSVDYSDILRLTLPYNRHHFSDVFVVTTPRDTETQRIATSCGAHVITTDVFYDHGAEFNKWAALEHGIDQMVRQGWFCVMDADVLWPKTLRRHRISIGTLYTPFRRMCDNIPQEVPDESTWSQFPRDHLTHHWSGYSHIFHATDPALRALPWYGLDWKHAGGADTFFQERWSVQRKARPPFEVLHIGERGRNWCGRVTQRADNVEIPEAAEREQSLQRYLRQRRGRKGSRRFDLEKIRTLAWPQEP